ncbi:hypothetical protein U9M48_020166 [Paspalum notatum var. saurae]|uniref:VQ domain-containing protein n=1 Tax=Paspalum notatum var. saurae TaxID=547442 RepID=A0AAQ3TEI1_PASNO
MANRFAGLDPTWAHLPTPAPAHAAAASHYCSSPSQAWLRAPAAAFENEALTSALRASMAPAPAHAATAAAVSSALSSPTTPSSSTSSASELLSSGGGGHDAPAPASTKPGGGLPARALAGPKGGRVAKRKPRPSRRAQTTYITADPADFRRMVQEITGLPVPGPSSCSSFPAAASASSDAGAGVAPSSWTPAPACVLPTLDTSAFLLERVAPATVPAPEDKSTGGGGYASSAVAAAGEDEDPSVLLELEALVRAPAGAIGFPTLDLESWGII